MLEYFIPEYDEYFMDFHFYKDIGGKLIVTDKSEKVELDVADYDRIIFKMFDTIPVIILVGNGAYIFRNNEWSKISSKYMYHDADIYFKTLVSMRGLLSKNHRDQISIGSIIRIDSIIEITNMKTNEKLDLLPKEFTIKYVFHDSNYVYILKEHPHHQDSWVIVDKNTGIKTDTFLTPYVKVSDKEFIINPTTEKTFKFNHPITETAKTWWYNDFFYVKTDKLRIYGSYQLDRLKYLSFSNKRKILYCIWLFSQTSTLLQPCKIYMYIPKALVLNLIIPHVLV